MPGSPSVASTDLSQMGVIDTKNSAENISNGENENLSQQLQSEATSVTLQATADAQNGTGEVAMAVEGVADGSTGASNATGDAGEEGGLHAQSQSTQNQSQTLNGAQVQKKSWHAEEDLEMRTSMVSHIVDLLRYRRPNASEDWTHKLPIMAKRLEDALYHSANSADEYKERSTLKARLQQLAQAFPKQKQAQAAPAAQSDKSSAVAGSNAGQASSGSNGAKPSDTDTEHRRQVLKQQQQRLLLLRHASKCTFELGSCTVTVHCADMKHLWKHIMTCKDQRCETAHCVSSRYVLAHYSKCKDDACPVCGPVKTAIQRNYIRTREIANNMRTGFNSQQQQITNRYAYQSNQIKRGRGNEGQVMPRAVSIAVNYPLDPVSCPLYCFTQEHVDAHIKTIHEGMKLTASKVRDICMPMLDELLRQKYAESVFGGPVDPTSMGLSDYTDIIKAPMDLGSIRKRLDLNYYRDLASFKGDVNLTFDNAILYNPKGTEISILGGQLKKMFSDSYKKTTTNLELEAEFHRNTARNCLICGDFDSFTKFEPPVFYCNGTCAQRIRRNANYYHTNRNDYHYCSPCFNDLKDGVPIKLSDYSIYKRDLLANKKKLTEADEPWVQCDGGCERWVHQVCGLFNSRRNFEEQSYICPMCLTEKKKTNPDMNIITTEKKKIQAHELPHSTMSLFLERRLNERLEEAYKDYAEKLNIEPDEVEKCPTLVLRQVAALEKTHQTRELMLGRYKDKGYPAEFPVKSKCICLFQNIDGQDTLLFAMYVYEYGHKCPAPNQRKIYISYLDSVHYLRPRQYRTIIYQEIIISYLDYVKRRGFHTVHIWACPPMKGDDYIFHIHPQDQKTPKEDKLRKWYADLLLEAKERGIVTEISDLYTECFKDPTKDATTFPYFEGDYCASEAEVIIKDLKDGKLTMDVPIGEEPMEVEGAADEDPNRLKRPKGRARRGARSAGVKLTDKPSERDPIMAKLASIIEPMKDAFFVARLLPKEYADACAARRVHEVIEESKHEAEERAKEEKVKEEALTGDTLRLEVPKEAIKVEVAEDDFVKSAASIGSSEKASPREDVDMDANQSSSAMPDDKAHVKEEKENPSTPKTKNQMPKSDGGSGLRRSSSRGGPKAKAKDEEEDTNDKKEEETTKKGGPKKRGAAEMEEEEGADEKAAEDTEVKVKSEKVDDDVKMEESDVKDVESKAVNGDEKTEEKVAGQLKTETELAPAGVATGLDEHGIPVCFADLKDDTEDVDDIQESEHFDNRLSFLNLCTGNHYQFDQLRRAKHSSTMVLYHLHNPDAPKFVPGCAVCHTEIISGYRHHCSTCELDYCMRCVTNYGPRIHPQHALRPIAVAGGAPVQLTEEQRKERARALQIHIELLVHAAECTLSTCTSKNCEKMKDYIRHEAICQVKMARGCRICSRVNGLFNVHSRACKKEVCGVPKCREIKEQTKKLTLRQNQMDDRRRAMMNDMYSRAATVGMSGGLAEQDIPPATAEEDTMTPTASATAAATTTVVADQIN